MGFLFSQSLDQQATKATILQKMFGLSLKSTQARDNASSASMYNSSLAYPCLQYTVSHIHAADPSHKVVKFSLKTSTGPLRRHLYEHHLDMWVTACDKLNINITAKEAANAVARHRQETGSISSSQPRVKTSFSKEAFVDAIVEFIVANDQVCNNIGSCIS
jgi:hypothetical protein